MNSTLPVQSPTETDPGIKPDAVQRAFAQALGRELDRIGYPAAPARANQLASDLGLGRMQAYRISRGDNMPSLKALIKLQSLGVSLDNVINELHESRSEGNLVAVEILGLTVKAEVLPALTSTPFVAAQRGGQTVMRVLAPGEPIAHGEVPIGGLRFMAAMAAVAVVEDDPESLAVLCKQIEPDFRVSGFPDGTSLLRDTARMVKFDALVLDWCLPDIDGAQLVRQVRTSSHAPIIVITGELREAHAISELMQLPDLYYAAKPVDEHILRALIASAINKAAAKAA